jgi:predicted ribosomally synthesized peptide with nif11-like leader
MAKQDVIRFLKAVDQDPQLQSRIKNVRKSKFLEVAKEAGHTLSLEDLKSVLDDHHAGALKHEKLDRVMALGMDTNVDRCRTSCPTP